MLSLSCAFAQTDTSRKPTDSVENPFKTKPATKPAEQKDTTKNEEQSAHNNQEENNNNEEEQPVQQVQTPATAADTIQQNTDTVKTDTTQQSVIIPVVIDTTSFYKYRNPLFNLDKPAVYELMPIKTQKNSDMLFYLLAGCLLIIGVIKSISPKYIQNVFSHLRQPTLQKHKDAAQQQTNIDAWVLNIFFVISAAMFVALSVSKIYEVEVDFMNLFLYSALALAIAYIIKFSFLSFAGWVFNIKETTNSYASIELMVNKILGIALLPFIIVLAFASQKLAVVAGTAGLCAIFIFIFYRFILSLRTFTKSGSINGLHFFIYLCAVEIAPVLIFIKMASDFLG